MWKIILKYLIKFITFGLIGLRNDANNNKTI